MAEKATILIPDISGFTEFTSATEIDHAAHIINELLELIIASNPMGFTLAEVEGDAVLFYLKEDRSAPSKIIDQCLETFRNFHTRLMVIERDTVCQCGACQSASNLTLNLIVHFGEIKEIKVAHFVKATGVDMIVAHRLLKNTIDSSEYILISKPCIDCGGKSLDTSNHLIWNAASQEYPAIGEIEFQYATLTDARSAIPKPTEIEEYVVVRGDDNLDVPINKPLRNVYQTLINVDARKDWMLGVDKINRDPITERIGMKHNCQFMGMTMINTCLHHEYTDANATYVERVEVPEMSLDTIDIYTLTPQDGGTLLNFNIHWKDTPLADEMKQGMLQGIRANLESLKGYLEG
jgi:hypothetical protein